MPESVGAGCPARTRFVSRGAGAVGRRGAPAPRANDLKPRASVKVQAPRTLSSRHHDRTAPAWGDPVPGYGWRFWAFVVGWSAFMALCAVAGGGLGR